MFALVRKPVWFEYPIATDDDARELLADELPQDHIEPVIDALRNGAIYGLRNGNILRGVGTSSPDLADLPIIKRLRARELLERTPEPVGALAPCSYYQHRLCNCERCGICMELV